MLRCVNDEDLKKDIDAIKKIAEKKCTYLISYKAKNDKLTNLV